MKKVLIITYYWPPAGGPGVHRILKMVKYLPEHGWQPVILTTLQGDYQLSDESLKEQLDNRLNVFQTGSFSILSFYQKFSSSSQQQAVLYGFTDTTKSGIKDRIGRWAKYNIVPDARIGWYRPAVKKATGILAQQKIDLIFSTSPPQTPHLIARKLARKTSIPWIADFRDPWTDVFWLQNGQRMKLVHLFDKHLEKKVVEQCNGLITVSSALVDLLRKKTQRPVCLVTNGYDEEDFQRMEYTRADKFRIVYTGSLSKQHVIEYFLDALKKSIGDKNLADDLEVHFWGNFPGFIYESVKDKGLQRWMRTHAYVRHSEIIDKMVNAEILLLLIPDTADNEGIMTSKIFNYVRSRRSVLGIGPPQGDAAKVLKQTGAGKMFDYADSDGIMQFIHTAYTAWKKDRRSSQPDKSAVGKYDWQNLTGYLTGFFDDICHRNPGDRDE